MIDKRLVELLQNLMALDKVDKDYLRWLLEMRKITLEEFLEVQKDEFE